MTEAPTRPVQRTHLLVALATSLAAFTACAVAASGGTASAPERSLFLWVNGWPDSLESMLWIFQLAGVIAVPLVLALVAVALRRRRLALLLVATIPLKLIVEHVIVKQLVHRERPGTVICHLDRSCAEFRHVPLAGLSFVSGHAIIAWAVATLAWPQLPRRWRWAPVLLATVNSIARIYLGAHLPLDVVGGAALGVVIGAALLLAVDHRGLGQRGLRPSRQFLEAQSPQG